MKMPRQVTGLIIIVTNLKDCIMKYFVWWGRKQIKSMITSNDVIKMFDYFLFTLSKLELSKFGIF